MFLNNLRSTVSVVGCLWESLGLSSAHSMVYAITDWAVFSCTSPSMRCWLTEKIVEMLLTNHSNLSQFLSLDIPFLYGVPKDDMKNLCFLLFSAFLGCLWQEEHHVCTKYACTEVFCPKLLHYWDVFGNVPTYLVTECLCHEILRCWNIQLFKLR